VDSIGAADPENHFIQKIGDAAVFFEILGQFPGFMDEQMKFVPAFAAANI